MSDIKYYNGSLVGKKYKPGITFDFQLSVPDVECDEFALLIEHDCQNDAHVTSMLRLADEGKAPYCVSIGVLPGRLVMPDGDARNMRMNCYDMFDREYGDFIVYELIPYISKEYSVEFSSSPDMHCVSGGSSGGISAFAIAWFHPEYFHRIYMSSPSFLAMGRGNEIPYLIRKYETKPIRIYEEISEHEPNDYFGWSRAIDEETREALIFAGYDFKCKYFSDEGHCSRYRNAEEAYIRNEWLWRGWDTEKITASRNSPRVAKIIPDGSIWERCHSFPAVKTPAPPSVLAEHFNKVVLSNDFMAWYAANTGDDCVYMFVNDGDLSLERSLLHATLHTVPRFGPKGALDMAVDKTDRLFVLTAVGIQCVRSFGLIDAVLDLPDSSNPFRIAISDALYVETENGVYRRNLCDICVAVDDQPRKYVSYYD